MRSRLGEIADLGYGLMTISCSSDELRDQREMGPNLIITNGLPVMTNRRVERMKQRVKPFGQQRQLNGGSDISPVCKDSKSFGNMSSARQWCAFQFVLEAF
jgi:hypothetical protein